MAKKFPTPTKYTLKHPEKYVGNPNEIIARSSWERRFMIWADTNSSVVKWNSEELVIPYISPIDNKPHRYFVDFMIMVRDKSGELKKYAVEVKPHYQTQKPVMKPRMRKQRFINEMTTYVVNQAKWEAADKFCRRNGAEFIVITENELGIK